VIDHRGAQEKAHAALDGIPVKGTDIEIERLCRTDPKLEARLRRHYKERILVPGRFTDSAFMRVLDANFDRNVSIPSQMDNLSPSISVA
jgi:hypothetical protein